MNSVIDVLLEVEQRWCACHTFANWSKRHRVGDSCSKVAFLQA